MAWVNQYGETLRDLGIEEDKLGFPYEANRGMGMLTDKYIERMRQQLNSWFTNIIQVHAHVKQSAAKAHLFGHQVKAICLSLLTNKSMSLHVYCKRTDTGVAGRW